MQSDPYIKFLFSAYPFCTRSSYKASCTLRNIWAVRIFSLMRSKFYSFYRTKIKSKTIYKVYYLLLFPTSLRRIITFLTILVLVPRDECPFMVLNQYNLSIHNILVFGQVHSEKCIFNSTHFELSELVLAYDIVDYYIKNSFGEHMFIKKYFRCIIITYHFLIDMKNLSRYKVVMLSNKKWPTA